MVTFELQLSETEWTEVLDGNGYLAFDCRAAKPVYFYMAESATPPDASAVGNVVRSWPENWDFVVSNVVAGTQRVWVRGQDTIIGVRG